MALLYLPAAHSMQPRKPTYVPGPQPTQVPSIGEAPVGQASHVRVVNAELSGHDTAHASYARTVPPSPFVPTAHDSSHAAAPGPVATKLAQSYTSPRSEYRQLGSSAHVVQHSAAVHGSSEQVTLCAG